MENLSNLCLSCFSNTGGLNPCPHCGSDRNHPKVGLQHLLPGTILDGNYLIGTALGQGGFGITYKAYDLKTGRILAVKEYFPAGRVTRQNQQVAPVDVLSSTQLKQGVNQFYKEALILANFNAHPNIVNVVHFFLANNTAYIVMEYVSGKSLKEYLAVRGGSISFTEAAQILCPIMGALADLHQAGLLHRDIAPDNIFLTADGKPKLLDFGAARFSFGDETMNAASVIKPGYAPLEQYAPNGGEQGPWTDVYAMGATFYRVLTGSVPLSASERALGKVLPSPLQSGVNLPESADAAIMHAMNMKQEDRFETMAEFLRAIRMSVSSESQYARAMIPPDESLSGADPRTIVIGDVSNAPEPEAPSPAEAVYPPPAAQPEEDPAEPARQNVAVDAAVPAAADAASPDPTAQPVSPVFPTGADPAEPAGRNVADEAHPLVPHPEIPGTAVSASPDPIDRAEIRDAGQNDRKWIILLGIETVLLIMMAVYIIGKLS